MIRGRAAAFAALLLALAGSAPGCGQRARSTTPTGDSVSVPAITNRGSCDFDLSGSNADTVFYTLGMLDEYLGRPVTEENDAVEGFYCNESALASEFRGILARLATEQGLNPTIRTETVQDCLTVYRSKPIADRLNSCYSYTLSDDIRTMGQDGRYKRTARARLSISLFERHAPPEPGVTGPPILRRRALAYLAGAWARYGDGFRYRMTNATDKATLIANLLSQLGCRNVWLKSNVGFIPQTNMVEFDATDEVKDWLGSGGLGHLPAAPSPAPPGR